jgi:hypothetical protein
MCRSATAPVSLWCAPSLDARTLSLVPRAAVMKSTNEAGKGRGALPYCCEVEERASGARFSKIAKAQKEWMSCGAPSIQ